MNALDIVILLLFIPGIIRGISKGFIEQAVSLAGIVASVWMAFKFSSLVSEKLSAYINVSDTVLKIVSFIIILIVVSIVVLLIAKLLTVRAVRRPPGLRLHNIPLPQGTVPNRF